MHEVSIKNLKSEMQENETMNVNAEILSKICEASSLAYQKWQYITWNSVYHRHVKLV